MLQLLRYEEIGLDYFETFWATAAAIATLLDLWKWLIFPAFRHWQTARDLNESPRFQTPRGAVLASCTFLYFSLRFCFCWDPETFWSCIGICGLELLAEVVEDPQIDQIVMSLHSVGAFAPHQRQCAEQVRLGAPYLKAIQAWARAKLAHASSFLFYIRNIYIYYIFLCYILHLIQYILVCELWYVVYCIFYIIDGRLYIYILLCLII